MDPGWGYTSLSSFSSVNTIVYYSATPSAHTCDRGSYQYYEAAHPHYKNYKCSICGEIWRDTSDPTLLATCDDCRPGKPALLNMRDSYETGEAVTFAWAGTSNTTHYNLWLERSIGNDKWENVEQIFYADNGLTRTFEAGEYRAQLLSYNSDLWETDRSDWVHTWSDDCFFTVKEPVVDSGFCGDNLTWTLEENGTLTISGTGRMDDYRNEYNRPWSRNDILSQIKYVIIEDGVTSIGDYAFSGCKALGNVMIPDGVTSIGDYAFENCTALTNVAVPGSVTSIGECAFTGSNTPVNVAPENEKYSSEDGNLYNKQKTALLYAGSCGRTFIIPDGVRTIGDYAFYGCETLTRVTIPNSVTSIGHHVFGESGLTSVNIPNSVIDIGHCAFEFCEDLRSVTIPNSVTAIADSMFWCCTSLTRITIPGSVTSIGDEAFYSCNALTSVTITDGVTSIGDSAFFGCTALRALTIPKSVTWIAEGAFNGASTSINVAAENRNYCSEDGVLYDKGKTTLVYVGNLTKESFTIPSSVTRIAVCAFKGCKTLTSITIPASVNNIGRSAFNSCTGLTSVTIPNSVTYIDDWAFIGCDNLTDVYYTGTAADWAKITIKGGNGPLTNATLHCAKSAPAAPVVKLGNSATSGKPMLTWNAVEGATSYRIYRSTSKGSGYSLLGTVTATSYTNTGAKAGTTYYYRVKACNDAGLSPYSNIVSGKVKTVAQQKPSAPVVKIGHSAASGKPMLTWNAVSGAASYKVYRATSQNGTYSLLGTVTTTSYTNTGAKAGTTYYYKVKAVNSAGESAYSNVVSGRATVTTLTMGHSSTSGKPQLTWKAVSGAASYKVYRATAKNGAYSVINTTKALTYTNVGAALGTTYYYKVEALNAAGKSMGFSAIVEGKVAPVLAVGYSSVSGKPQLTWKAVPGATEYQVYRSIQQNSGYTKINTTTATSYVNTGAKANTTYYYKIVAVKGTAVSDFSNIVSARPSK